MQFEMDKHSSQLNQLKLLQGELTKINLTQPFQQAGFGSLILTNQGNYLLSVSLGKAVVDTASYYALSLASPLGKVLLGKSVGDSFFFQEKEGKGVLLGFGGLGDVYKKKFKRGGGSTKMVYGS